jgi:hypothetical protein
MKRRRKTAVLGLAVVAALLGAASVRQVTDGEARKYYREELSVFLDSLVYQMCQVKYAYLSSHASVDIPGRLICPGASSPSPTTPVWALLGSAGTSSGAEKDSPARTYIRNDLQPWVDSVTYNLCHIKTAAAPAAPGRIICPGPPEGYKKPPANGAP